MLKTRTPNKAKVIVKKSSPKNLSANCRSTVGRQLTDRLPTVYRQLTNVLHMLDVVSSENREKTLRFVLMFYRQATDRLPTHYQQSAHCRPTVGPLSAHCRLTGSLYFGQNLSADRRPTVGRQRVSSSWGSIWKNWPYPWAVSASRRCHVLMCSTVLVKRSMLNCFQFRFGTVIGFV